MTLTSGRPAYPELQLLQRTIGPMLSSVRSSPFGIAIVAWVLWQHDPGGVLGWGVARAVVSSALAAFLLFAQRSACPTRLLGSSLLGVECVNAASWASLPFFVSLNEDRALEFVALVVVLRLLIAAPNMAAYPPLFRVSFFTTVVVGSLAIASEGTPLAYPIAGSLCVGSVYALFTFRKAHLMTAQAVDAEANSARLLLELEDERERLRSQNEQLATQSRTDALTGLPNRAELQTLIDTIAVATPDALVAVAYLDIDHFKRVNDQFGHAVGDQVLREAARRWRRALRRREMIARMGGDEFVAVFSDPSRRCEDSIAEVGERLRSALDRPIPTSLGEVAVSCSVGVAVLRAGLGYERLLGSADDALYCAKRRGRNAVSTIDEAKHPLFPVGATRDWPMALEEA